jgi:hypothetical protein
MPAEATTRYYIFENGSRRYRNADSRRFVSRAAVRASLDTVLDVQMERARSLSADLVAGNVTLSEWRSEMVTALKISHLEGAAVARGGWLQLTQADYSWLSNQRIRPQLTYLQNFHDDLAYGRAPMDGTIASRAAMYVEAGVGTNRQMESRMAEDRGEELERNIGMDDDRTCDGCQDASDQGWVPLGTLIPVGERDCLSNDRCFLDFRTGRPDE